MLPRPPSFSFSFPPQDKLLGYGTYPGLSKIGQRQEYMSMRPRLRKAKAPNIPSVLLEIRGFSGGKSRLSRAVSLYEPVASEQTGFLSCTSKCKDLKVWSQRFRTESQFTVWPWVRHLISLTLRFIAWKWACHLLHHSVVTNTKNGNKNASSTVSGINYSNMIPFQVLAKHTMQLGFSWKTEMKKCLHSCGCMVVVIVVGLVLSQSNFSPLGWDDIRETGDKS